MFKHSLPSMLRLGLVSLLTGSLAMAATAADKNPALKVLLIDGQNKSHDWQSTSVVMLKQLELNANFRVTRLTTPADGKAEGWKDFEPDFKAYDLVVLNYWGTGWPEEDFTRLKEYVNDGGGLATVHSALAAFEKHPEFADMVGLTWRGKGTGKRVYLDENGKLQSEAAGEGIACGHSHQFSFKVKGVDGSPLKKIIDACPDHNKDELYHALRGPAKDLSLHGVATSPSTKKDELMVWTLKYGKGRSFVTTLGHSAAAMDSEVFCQSFVRGCYWAATGKDLAAPLTKRPVAPSRATIERNIDPKITVHGKYAAVKLPITKGVKLWNPTCIIKDDKGTLWASNYTGEIFSLVDSDGDGLEDTAELFCNVTDDELRYPTGMVWKDGKLYVGTTQEIRVYEDTTGDGKADSSKTFFKGFPWTLHPFDWTFGLDVGPDGNFYFILCTDYLNNAAAPDPNQWRGSLLRLSPDGKKLEKVAVGLRFAYGMAFDHEGELFFSDNKSGGNAVDEINHVVEGGYYGHDPRKHGSDLKTIGPIHAIKHGYGPGNMEFNSLNNSFDNTAGNLFLANWGPDGRWDRGSLVRFEITQKEDKTYEVKEHLVAAETPKIIDLAFGNNGDLYVAQFGQEGPAHRPFATPIGAIYRFIQVPWAYNAELEKNSLIVVGDPENGKKVFAARACATCHSPDGSENLLGPDLASIGSMLNRTEFLQDVADPNMGIKSDFETVEVIKTDGTKLLGRISGQDEELISLMLPGNKIIDIPKGQVKSTKMLTTSLMPPGLLTGIDAKDLNDLLAYLKVREVNLLAGVKFESVSTWSTDGKSGKIDALTDGNQDSYYDQEDDKDLYHLRADLGKPTSMTTLGIQGFAQQNYAPKDFTFIVDGKEVLNIKDATYKENKWEQTFPTVTGKVIELRITGYYGKSAAIRELSLF